MKELLEELKSLQAQAEAFAKRADEAWKKKEPKGNLPTYEKGQAITHALYAQWLQETIEWAEKKVPNGGINGPAPKISDSAGNETESDKNDSRAA